MKNDHQIVLNRKSKENYKKELIINDYFVLDKIGIIHQPFSQIIKDKPQSIYYKTLAMKFLKETKLDEERFKKRIEEANSMHSPIINSKSILLVSQNKRRNVPLYQRITEIQNQHKKRLIQLRETYSQQHKEDNSRIIRVKSENCFQSWLALNKQREQARKEKIKNIRIELSIKKSNDMYNNMSFKSYINEKSKRIVNENTSRNLKHSSSSSQIDQTSQRLYQSYFKYRNRKNELRRMSTPSFKPIINSRNSNQIKTYLINYHAHEL